MSGHCKTCKWWRLRINVCGVPCRLVSQEIEEALPRGWKLCAIVGTYMQQILSPTFAAVTFNKAGPLSDKDLHAEFATSPYFGCEHHEAAEPTEKL